MFGKLIHTIILCTLIIITAAGCKTASKESAGPEMISSGYSGDVSLENGAIPVGSNTEQPEVVDDRKRVKKGDVSYRVHDLKEAERVLIKKVAEYAGYVDSSNFWGSTLTLVVKIPADNFDNFVTASESVGKLISKNIVVEDVTDRFTDLDNRIKNRRILLERYQDYLKKAKDVSELVKLEREINNLTTEIEGLEGSFKSLKHQISYSRLEISLVTTAGNTITRNWPSLKSGFGGLGFALTNFFYVLFFLIIYVICFGIPIILLVAVVYWLTIGKLGLLRRLFTFLSPKAAGKKEENV